jgi:hypothetical protein
MTRWFHVIAIVLTAASADAQVAQHEDRTLTIRAESVPLATLLSEIARVYPIDRVTLQTGVEQRLVSIVLERVDPGTALVAILTASGLDFAISGRRVIAGDWTGPIRAVPTSDEAPALASGAGDPTASEPETRQRAEAREVERQAVERAATAAEQQAISDAAGDESTILPTMPVAFVANGENITYLEPNFVPYKMRPEVRARRMATDVAKIP